MIHVVSSNLTQSDLIWPLCTYTAAQSKVVSVCELEHDLTSGVVPSWTQSLCFFKALLFFFQLKKSWLKIEAMVLLGNWTIHTLFEKVFPVACL